MTPHVYLTKVLQSQTMAKGDIATLQRFRGEIEGCLRGWYGNAPRFYYGGSYGKDTMLKESFDLDIVMYLPSSEPTPLRDIFANVHARLVYSGYVVRPKTVALRLPHDNGFHIDVVPGRAQDASYRLATLHVDSGNGGTRQTSLKVHIDEVRKTGIRETVKLIKLWRLRHGLSMTTFALEIATRRALQGRRKDDLSTCMIEVLSFLARDLMTARLVDPANSNNVVEMSQLERWAVSSQAEASLRAANWEDIVW